MKDLSSPVRDSDIELRPRAAEVQSPSHWTAREFLRATSLSVYPRSIQAHTHTHTHTTMHCILELAFSVFLLHRGKGSTCLAMVNTFLEPHQHNYKDFFPAIFSFSVISSLSSLSFSLLHHSQKHKKKIFSSPILKYKQVKNNKMKEKLSVEPMFPSAFTPFSWVPFTTT